MLKEKTLNGLLYINFLLLPPPLEINGHTNVERKTIKGLLSNNFFIAPTFADERTQKC